MHYNFPVIRTIHDVLPAIADSKEFSVIDKGDYQVINYFITTPDTFPSIQTLDRDANNKAIRRECRGIIFDKEGNIIARRLHKFFNVNEKPETTHIDLSQPHTILVKLDGSMITPFLVNDEVRWGTKMGETDISLQVQQFVDDHQDYVKFAELLIALGATPIFEWCSRKQRIVIDHPKDKLILIAIRHNISGEYWSYNSICSWAGGWHIPVVEEIPGKLCSMEQLIDYTRGLEDEEGYVVRFDDGHMVKIKSEWYVRIHKAKELISSEKRIIANIINNTLDDVKPFLPEADLEYISTYEKNFWLRLWNNIDEFEELYQKLVQNDVPKKEFAINYTKLNGLVRNYIFNRYNGKDGETYIIDYIRKNISTGRKLNSIKWLWTESYK